MAARKPQRRADPLRQERALERARQRALERAQQPLVLQDLGESFKYGMGKLYWLGRIPLSLAALWGIFALLFLEGESKYFYLCAGLFFLNAPILWLFLCIVVLQGYDAIRRVMIDAVDERQLRRVLERYEGEVPVGALEAAGEEGAERGAVSLAEDAPSGALSPAQDEARQ